MRLRLLRNRPHEFSCERYCIKLRSLSPSPETAPGGLDDALCGRFDKALAEQFFRQTRRRRGRRKGPGRGGPLFFPLAGPRPLKEEHSPGLDSCPDFEHGFGFRTR